MRILLYGMVSWLVPFVIAVPFYGPDGALRVSPGLFKSVMLVVGTSAGAILLLRIFQRRPTSARAGLWIGLAWLVINLSLDLLIVVPMSGMSLATYLTDLGARYLTIPVLSIVIERAGRAPR